MKTQDDFFPQTEEDATVEPPDRANETQSWPQSWPESGAEVEDEVDGSREIGFEASVARPLPEPAGENDPAKADDPADVALFGAQSPPERRKALPRALGIRLRKAGQVFFFPDEEHTVRIGSKVVVALEQGPALGEVESIIHGDIPLPQDEEGARMQGRVMGLATAQDIALHAENSILAAEAAAFCKTCIRQRGLEMKLVTVEVLHDRSKILFFFTAPSRIDFRELVKDLVRNYRTRIELRQIGVRHETQMIGGLGNCGMVCCCHKYLRTFAPVTIKMAKEQNLFLNPSKLSGMCGRLLCCLSFEQGNYEDFTRRSPKPGKKYATAQGTVKVLRANLFNQSISVLSEKGEETQLSLEEWNALEQRGGEQTTAERQQAASAPPALSAEDEERRRGAGRCDNAEAGADGLRPEYGADRNASPAAEDKPDRQSRQRKRRKRQKE